MPSLIETIKKVAMAVYNESKPFALAYGVVENINPLLIKVDQKLPLTKEFLILTNMVKDYNVEVTLGGTKQICTIHNGLKINEKVLLLRVQGGQQYIVLDRV